MSTISSPTESRLRGKPSWGTTKMSLTKGGNSSNGGRRSSSSSSDPRSSIPYHQLENGKFDIGKRRGMQRGHGLMVIAVMAFIVFCTFFSILPGKDASRNEMQPKLRFDNSIDAKTMLVGTSERSLTWAERNDKTWSDGRCRQEFPLLYPQLEDITQYWKERGGLNRSNIDRNEDHVKPNTGVGYTRVLIRGGQLFIRSFSEGPETRNSALIHHLLQVIASWPTTSPSRVGQSRKADDVLPTIDLILSPGDKEAFADGGGWAVTKRMDDVSQNGTWLIPDFGFIGWPEAGAASYEEFIELAADVEKRYPWKKKYDRMFWRGFANWYPPRRDLMERTTLKGNPGREIWSDVHETTFHPEVDVGDYYPLVSLHDHCQHKYLVHTEGNSYSGRSKYLFSCRSITIAHPLEWTQHFHPALNPIPESPNQNYVSLFGPHFAGLEEAAMEMREGDADSWFGKKQFTYTGKKKAEQVADNAIRTLRDRYLSPAATMCYTRAALRHYAEATVASSWGPTGPQILPGQGIAPGVSKGRPMAHLKGDIEAGSWRLLGGPNWPPGPDPVVKPKNESTLETTQKVKGAKALEPDQVLKKGQTVKSNQKIKPGQLVGLDEDGNAEFVEENPIPKFGDAVDVEPDADMVVGPVVKPDQKMKAAIVQR